MLISQTIMKKTKIQNSHIDKLKKYHQVQIKTNIYVFLNFLFFDSTLHFF